MSFTIDFLFYCIGALVLLCMVKEIYEEIKRSRIPASIPWVGVRNNEFLPKIRAWMRELTAGLTTVEEGYKKYNTKGKPFALVDTAGRSQVIVPKEMARWMVGQPETVFSQRHVLKTKFAIKYLIPPAPKIIVESVVQVLRHDLTRNLGKLQPLMYDILRYHFDNILGMDEKEWREVDLVNVIQPAFDSAFYRILVGEVLSRDEKSITSFKRFGQALGLGAVAIGQFVPFFLAPPVGFVAAWLVALCRRRALAWLTPVVQQRVDDIQRAKIDPTFVYEAPMDVIQWLATAAGDEATISQISDAVLSVGLAAIHPTITTATTAFHDMLSSPPKLEHWSAIHEEAAGVFRSKEDWGNAESLQKLSKIDSAVRESMRLNPHFGRGFMQEVLNKDGVDLPNGLHLPQRAWLGVSMIGVHTDERYYPDPHTYDPFRFSRAREELLALNGKSESTDKAVVDDQVKKLNGTYLATTEDRFTAFGLGGHSCPGRWFASKMMKLALAYVALHYEIQQIPSRQPSMIIGDCIVPQLHANIRVRRRKVVR